MKTLQTILLTVPLLVTSTLAGVVGPRDDSAAIADYTPPNPPPGAAFNVTDMVFQRYNGPNGNKLCNLHFTFTDLYDKTSAYCDPAVWVCDDDKVPFLNNDVACDKPGSAFRVTDFQVPNQNTTIPRFTLRLVHSIKVADKSWFETSSVDSRFLRPSGDDDSFFLRQATPIQVLVDSPLARPVLSS
ncbi:MAG: hypothetical protein M1825_001049 [Sarcosagium campestre]|nr:MAG: hypothetical protein M1825_001049 [Sarcosagium campestre]